MFKKNIIRSFVALSIVVGLSFGISYFEDNRSVVPELVSYVDSDLPVQISEEATPVGAPKVTKSVSVKTTKKKIKLKKAAKKTYVKNGKTTCKTTTKKKKSGNSTTTTVTEKQTSIKDKFTKGSKIQIRLTTVKTTITKSISKDVISGVTTSAYSRNSNVSSEVGLDSIASKADTNVLSAFHKMGFKVISDQSVSYTGLFDARSRTITLKSVDDTIYHELGHFLSFVAGNFDKTSSFVDIYKREMNNYTYYNKNYAISSASEYFAESYKNYILNKEELKSNRPETYAAIQSALSKVTDSQVNSIIKVYSSIWK